MVAPPKTPIPQSQRDGDACADPADEVYIHLSERDRDTVLEAIDSDSQPNENLRSAAERYKQRYG